MQRFVVDMNGWLEPDDNGDLVRADDAEKEIERLRAQVEAMRPVVEAARTWRADHADTDWICCHPLAAAVDALPKEAP